MLRTTFFIVFSFLISWSAVEAQDLHYSQFFNSPLNLSPSLTGAFNGDQRYHLNYRKQWASVPVNYISGDVGADFKLRNKKNSNYLGLGGLINYDEAGDLGLNFTGLNLFASYSIKLSTKSELTPAVTVSYAQRKIDYSSARTGGQWDGVKFDPNIPAEVLNLDNFSYFDIGAGLNYRWQSAYRKHLDIGISAYHLIKPIDSFNSNATYVSERPMRISAYAMFNYPIAGGLDIILNGLYAKQDSYSEKVINAQLKIYIGKNQNTAFYLGGGYRFDDAWYPMAAIEIGRVYGAFSYDFNISDFEFVSGGEGGPELSLRYIIANIPKGINKPCPLY